MLKDRKYVVPLQFEGKNEQKGIQRAAGCTFEKNNIFATILIKEEISTTKCNVMHLTNIVNI